MPLNKEQLDFIGKGWNFPFELSKTRQIGQELGVGGADSIEKIIDSIRQILGTEIGSRWYRRGFGSHLGKLVFRNTQTEIEDFVRFYVIGAVERWEKRIKVLNVRIEFPEDSRRDGVNTGSNRIDINMDFQIRRTNEIGNFVYPFYLDGTHRVTTTPRSA